MSDGIPVSAEQMEGVVFTDGNGNATMRYSHYEAVLRDAQRYRWLKENHLQLGPDCWIRTGDDLDEAIDAELDAPGRCHGA